MPYFLAVLFISNAFILDGQFYRVVFGLQAVFYFLALSGAMLHTRSRILGVPLMFCVMNMAAVVGLYRFLTRKQGVLWRRAE